APLAPRSLPHSRHNLLHHHCRQSIPPCKVRPFTLTRPNTQHGSAEQSHACKTCLAHMESTVQAPVFLAPLWQNQTVSPCMFKYLQLPWKILFQALELDFNPGVCNSV
uniref:Uncharacterized protein n=1 Tax=Calidris pygmaea TaxID=425635 RepID=A0A8C3KWJ0_9CHAR